tara:strand:- start:3144 stop:4211 length:1068 start_codon:yes stop_codon:yes gene_type:complete
MSEETKTLTAAEATQIFEEAFITNTTIKMSDDGTEHRPLKYPFSDINRYGARIAFIPKLITGPKLEGDMSFSDLLKTVGKSITSSATAKDFEKDKKKLAEDSKKEGGGVRIGKGINMPLTSKKIDIYLPISFNATDTMTYDSPSIGSAGAILGNSLNQASGGSVGEVLGGAVGDFINLFQGAGGVGANSLAKLGAAKLAKRGPTEVGDGVASSLRVTVDPNIRTLFRGVQVRQFAFQFKFIAKNSKEAKEIKDIIKRFRFYAYPESIGFQGSGQEISVGFKYPHPFEIRASYMDAEGKSTPIGPLMKDSYLTSITTNYNPSTMAFHQDGEPVEIDLSLNFTEETTLNKKDILGGY